MKIYEVEIERTYTAYVAAEDIESAQALANGRTDEIARECELDCSEFIRVHEITDLTRMPNEPVYCEAEGIHTVKDALRHANAQAELREEEEMTKPCKYTLSLFPEVSHGNA